MNVVTKRDQLFVVAINSNGNWKAIDEAYHELLAGHTVATAEEWREAAKKFMEKSPYGRVMTIFDHNDINDYYKYDLNVIIGEDVPPIIFYKVNDKPTGARDKINKTGIAILGNRTDGADIEVYEECERQDIPCSWWNFGGMSLVVKQTVYSAVPFPNEIDKNRYMEYDNRLAHMAVSGEGNMAMFVAAIPKYAYETALAMFFTNIVGKCNNAGTYVNIGIVPDCFGVASSNNSFIRDGLYTEIIHDNLNGIRKWVKLTKDAEEYVQNNGGSTAWGK